MEHQREEHTMQGKDRKHVIPSFRYQDALAAIEQGNPYTVGDEAPGELSNEAIEAFVEGHLPHRAGTFEVRPGDHPALSVNAAERIAEHTGNVVHVIADTIVDYLQHELTSKAGHSCAYRFTSAARAYVAGVIEPYLIHRI
jgi:hypothetical protein